MGGQVPRRHIWRTRGLMGLLFAVAVAGGITTALEAQRADSAAQLASQAQATTEAVRSDAIAARIDAANAEATATIAADSAAQSQATAQVVSEGLVAQPTPTVPTLTICLMEDFDTSAFACRRTTSNLNLAAVPDAGVVFNGNGDVSGYASMTWRVFQQQAYSLYTTLGSYNDTDVDPQNDSVQWTLGDLFNSLGTNATDAPSAGQYKIEILSPHGNVLAAIEFALVESGGYIDSP